MDIQISAKPIEWRAESSPTGNRSWVEDRYGFGIDQDDAQADEDRYMAWWGENETDYFASLEDAKAWCQQQADELVRDWAMVTSNAGVKPRSEAASGDRRERT